MKQSSYKISQSCLPEISSYIKGVLKSKVAEIVKSFKKPNTKKDKSKIGMSASAVQYRSGSPLFLEFHDTQSGFLPHSGLEQS